MRGGFTGASTGSTSSDEIWIAERLPSMHLTVTFSMGTPEQIISLTIVLDHPYMKVNIASASSGCASFVPSLSTTQRSEATTWRDRAGIRQIKLYHDTVHGARNFAFLGFNCINQIGGELGLSLFDDGIVKPALKQFQSADVIAKPVFSFHVFGDEHGELVFGDADAAQYVGELKFVPLLTATSWKVALDAISVGATSFATSTATAYISPADLFVTGPVKQVQQMAAQIGARDTVNGYLIDCDAKLTNAQATLGGEIYTLDENMLGVEIAGECYFSVQTHGGNDPVWYLGGPFTRKYYTLFDGQEQRMGVATLAPQSSTLLP